MMTHSLENVDIRLGCFPTVKTVLTALFPTTTARRGRSWFIALDELGGGNSEASSLLYSPPSNCAQPRRGSRIIRYRHTGANCRSDFVLSRQKPDNQGDNRSSLTVLTLIVDYRSICSCKVGDIHNRPMTSCDRRDASAIFCRGRVKRDT